MRRRPLAVLLLAGLVASGCASTTTGPAGPAVVPSTSRVVPAVQNPLDVEAFLSNPCTLIAEQQAADLGLPVSEADTLAGRVACTWRKDQNNPAPLEVLRVQVLKDYGLAKISAECKIGCESWATADIAGYPAMHANGPLESKYGMCKLYVGITDTRTIMVTDGDLDAMRQGAAESAAGGPKCDRTDQVATLVIQRVKDGR